MYGGGGMTLQDQDQVGWRTSLRTYGNLLDCCARQIEPSRALALLDRMKAEGIEPDSACYHSVLDACSQAGESLVEEEEDVE